MTGENDFFEKHSTVFLDVFDDGGIMIYKVTTIADIEYWGYLKHSVWLSVIDEESNIKIDIKTLHGLKNAEKIVDLIEAPVQ